MLFKPTAVPPAQIIEIEPHADARGFFARYFCEREFEAAGLPIRFPQISLSRNAKAGTLRGMHFQVASMRESKLVRCVAGAIFDVIVDMRADSPQQLKWIGVELSAAAGNALFVPEGFAHGFITLADDTDVLYQISEFHRPGGARGLRWNDPALGIQWPREPAVIHERDATYPDYDPETFDG